MELRGGLSLKDRFGLHQIGKFRTPSHIGRPFARVLVRVDTVDEGIDDHIRGSVGDGFIVRKKVAAAIHEGNAANPKIRTPIIGSLQFTVLGTQVATNILVTAISKYGTRGIHHAREASVIAIQATVACGRHNHHSDFSRRAAKISIVVLLSAVGAVGGSGEGHEEGGQNQAEHSKQLVFYAFRLFSLM